MSPHSKTGYVRNRRCRLEPLESRCLLSAVACVFGPMPLRDAANLVGTAVPAAAAVVTNPTISKVAVSEAKGTLTWNVYDAVALTSASLTIDGTPVTAISGPYQAASGVNYSAKYGTLAAGSHDYTIRAVDKNGGVATLDGSFTLAGPTISKVAISKATGRISWNVAASAGVASTTLSIDGTDVTAISGPYTAASGFNYSAEFGTLAAGSHTYTITAVDKNGDTSSLDGSFTLDGPTISKVAVSQATGAISWNVDNSGGVKSMTLAIDGTSVTAISGPYKAASGVNYSAKYGTLSAASHTYTITATDNFGAVSTLTGSFTLDGPAISKVAVSAAKGMLTWNIFDSIGVASTTLAVDGTKVTAISGPYTAASGINYSANYGVLSAASHTYTITATDKSGAVTTLTGTFTLAGPTISKVAFSLAKQAITWNLLDLAGVQSTSIAFDGKDATAILGPYKAASGANYSAWYGALAAGSHTYTITATDKLGSVSTLTDTFILPSF